jgi:hypothetical protein
MTEAEIQNKIFFPYNLRGNLIISPSSMVLGWESDMIVVTKALLVHEFEIKLTHADFLADRKKDKWQQFEMWQTGQREYVHTFGAGWQVKMQVQQPPNYFWYACPRGVIDQSEVQPWAGLMVIDKNRNPITVKKAARLHGNPLPAKGLYQLCGSMNSRYWHYRLNSPLQIEGGKGNEHDR